MAQEQQATLMNNHHYLIVFFPVQGHINPSLQLAKNLVRNGAKVTLGTTNRGLKQIKSLPTLTGLSFASILDYQDSDDSQTHKEFLSYLAELRSIGPQNLSNLLQKFLADGEPVTLLVYSIILPWAAAVARDLQVPSAFFFNQCATVLTIYHRFLNSQDGIHGKINSSPSIEVSGLPLFSSSDIPTFLIPDNPFSSVMIKLMQEHIHVLEQEPRSFVLVNTFEELEQESIKAVANMNVIAVGPLMPSAFCGGSDLTDKSFGGDLFCQSKDYFEWLDSKPKRSVIYVSFGSLAVLKKEQKEEIFHALVESGRPFFWVLRSSNNEEEEVHKMMENGLNGDGIIVPWCSQVEVLSHRSIGCFVTHSGWNSTLESMVSGVPIIGCPQFSDQTTNAKMVDEVWCIGVRAKANEENIIERDEFKKCLDIVMGDGDRGKEIRGNAGKWKGLAIEAVKEGGSSYNNLKILLEITR
ncbi:crocetin glucosyltransferase, chloroplastic-like isoform X1 [Olea europaea var. sylvestris]|uniref:crocetin glucosyltransferase, chloroplastic-like isoform X1 n=1 Tax=Olea europaea var. sylvestris TaxID=158386 RepID=UPI000C1D0F65|nr:crocetin glucosyltransferase, chloroplastic-like isoform X1 [Olea europaea var. sylvestris]